MWLVTMVSHTPHHVTCERITKPPLQSRVSREYSDRRFTAPAGSHVAGCLSGVVTPFRKVPNLFYFEMHFHIFEVTFLHMVYPLHICKCGMISTEARGSLQVSPRFWRRRQNISVLNVKKMIVKSVLCYLSIFWSFESKNRF